MKRITWLRKFVARGKNLLLRQAESTMNVYTTVHILPWKPLRLAFGSFVRNSPVTY
jgi:hypothetical protein